MDTGMTMMLRALGIDAGKIDDGLRVLSGFQARIEEFAQRLDRIERKLDSLLGEKR